MSLTATYDPLLSRIRLSATLLGSTATYAVFDRTTDGVTWTTIRGGGHVTVTGQNAALDDYEWEPGIPTTYRVRSFIDGGADAHWWVSGPLNLAGWTAPDYTDIPTGSLAFGDRFVYPASHDKFTWNGDTWNYDGATGPDGTAGQVIPDPAGATFTTVTTQDLDAVWLKVPAAPFLNQAVTVVDVSEIARRSRAGLFDVVGRSKPVMVGDVASSIAFTLRLLTQTPADEENLDYLFASGEVVYLQLPSTVTGLPGGYFAVGDVTRASTLRLSPRRVWTIPLREVAAPGPDVVGSAYTWTSVLADCATWTDLLAANATWNDLLQRTGTPSDVIVG